MSDHKFPSRCRLLQADEFDAVFQNCDYRVSNRSFLFLAKRNSQGFNRLGMVVSKKSVPRAVDRNRIKRKIREIFRHLQPVLTAGLDLVVLTRPGVRQEENLTSAIDRTFTELFEKASRS